jgi:DNA glycosylase AlkZ-like
MFTCWPTRPKSIFWTHAFYKRVYRNQGWISPVVLVDGEIAGVWGHKLARTGIEIEAELFAPVARSVREQIEVRAQELADLFRRPLLFSFKN